MTPGKPQFRLENAEQFQRFVELMQRSIEQDCNGGREMIAQEKKPGGKAAAIPPRVLATIEKNIDIRQAIFEQMIANTQRVAQGSGNMDLASLHDQFVLGCLSATMQEDDYFPLFISRVDMELPAEIAAKVKQTGWDPKQTKMSVITWKGTSPPDMETLECMKARVQTVERVNNLVFNNFYLAATGKETIDYRAPDFIAYARDAERLISGSGPGTPGS